MTDEGRNGQVWEVDKKLLQQHALLTVEAYGYTTETLLRALDMDEFLPGPLGPPAKLLGGPRVSRRAIRAGRCLQLPLIAACSCMCSGACASCWAILCWGSNARLFQTSLRLSWAGKGTALPEPPSAFIRYH